MKWDSDSESRRDSSEYTEEESNSKKKQTGNTASSFTLPLPGQWGGAALSSIKPQETR